MTAQEPALCLSEFILGRKELLCNTKSLCEAYLINNDIGFYCCLRLGVCILDGNGEELYVQDVMLGVRTCYIYGTCCL